MFVFHVRQVKPKIIALCATTAIILCAVLLLPGCLGKKNPSSDPIIAPTVEKQVAYLEQLGWQVSTSPLETLELQLPEDLKADYADYCKLQEKQKMPFADFAGQTVKRYTFTVTNYPQIEHGVQANLYLCGEQIIGGDIIATGENGFQTELTFPNA
ncbi:MAG: DUF4830 domain-containing protein [Eubacteriales bacterium]|nr:DUF4830 domain-containing protein [Eubacteriales bacterium]